MFGVICVYVLPHLLFYLICFLVLSKCISSISHSNSTEKKKQKQHGEMKEFEVKVIKTVEVCRVLGELFDAFESDMYGRSCCHLYTIQQQYNALRMMKHRLNSSRVVLHKDMQKIAIASWLVRCSHITLKHHRITMCRLHVHGDLLFNSVRQYKA